MYSYLFFWGYPAQIYFRLYVSLLWLWSVTVSQRDCSITWNSASLSALGCLCSALHLIVISYAGIWSMLLCIIVCYLRFRFSVGNSSLLQSSVNSPHHQNRTRKNKSHPLCVILFEFCIFLCSLITDLKMKYYSLRSGLNGASTHT